MRTIRYKLRAVSHRFTAATHSTLHHTWKMAIAATAVIIIVAGLLLGAARLLSPMLGEFRGDIEAWASAAAGQPVKIGALGADWSGWLPLIRLTDVRVYDTQGERVLLRFSDTLMRVDLPAYLRDGRVEPSHLVLVGAHLSFIRTSEGNIVLEGFETSNLEDGVFVQWLLRQGRFNLRQSQIDWTDQEAGKARRSFNNVNLLLRTDGKRHQVSGALDLGTQPSRVTLALDFGGDLNAPRSWGGKVYLQARELELGSVQQIIQAPAAVAAGGTADFRLWGEWADTHLQRLEGEAAAHDMRLTLTDRPALEIRRVSTQLQWQREAQGWTLSAERFVLERDTAALPSRLVIVSSVASDGVPQLDARVSEWRIEDAASLLLAAGIAEPVLRAPLTGMQPRGKLHDIRLRFTPQPAGGTFKNFYLHARVDGISTRAFRDWPALDNVSGELQCDERSGSLELGTRKAHLAFSDLRKPLAIENATGRVGWERGEQSWRVGLQGMDVTSSDVNARVDGTIEWPHDGSSPSVNLQSSFASPNIGRVPDYLPDKVPEKARAWFTRALVTGRVKSGSATVRGRLSDFPFDASNGLFEARMTLGEALLDYEPGWPWVGEIEGEVIFSGRSLVIHVVSGKVLDSEVQKVTATIPDVTLEEPLLTVQGTARGAATDVLRLLRESPLKDELGGYVTGLSARGETTLDLDLLVPLSHRPNTIKGRLQFKEGALRYVDKAQERDIELTRINGALNFTGDMRISGNDISAVLLNQKVKLALRTEMQDAAPKGARQSLAIEARGRVDKTGIVRQLKTLAPDLQVDTLDWLHGDTDWIGALRLRAAGDAGFESEWRLMLPLKGMAVQLPDPLGKPAEEVASFMVESAPVAAPQSRRFNMSYGSRLNGAFEFARAKKTWEFARGELHFGETVATLPPQGLRVSGELPHLAVAEWQEFFARGGKRTGGLADKLNAVDVRIATLELFGQRLNNIQVRASQTPQAWEANIDGVEFAGSVRLTREKEAMLVMDLERLHLGKVQGGGGGENSDPRLWPALRIDAASFKYGAADFGRLHLAAARRSSGLRIDSLSLASADFQIDGQGDWVIEQDKPSSRFMVKATSEDMGKMLTAFGYAAPLSGGKSQIDLSAAWAGAPADFALDRLNGNLTLRATKGRLLEVDPGAGGRVFGLLSLQALPRRLTLDFSDIFAKGFSFDRIEGYFVLEDGNAYTNNLVMEGPSAKISVTGRTGLAAKDYDQVVTVKPEISEGLSVGAGLAGGPVVGLSLFLANKLLPGLKDIASYQYTIKGSWKEPVIAPFDQDKAGKKKSAG